MFGKRTSEIIVPRGPRSSWPRRHLRPRPSRSSPSRSRPSGRGQVSIQARKLFGFAGLPTPPLRRILRRQDDCLQRADRHHRSDAAREARQRGCARGDPRHRQRDRPDQERRDVDRRAGGTARGHLQRRAGLWAAGAAAGSRRDLRHHGQRGQHDVHRSQRQGAEDGRALCRQPAAHEHLPAHRQPGRPARR